jgi:hypothetical protein
MNTNTLVTAPGAAVARAGRGVGVGAGVGTGVGVRVGTLLWAGWVLDDAATGDVVLAVEHPDKPRATIKTSAAQRWDMTPQ